MNTTSGNLANNSATENQYILIVEDEPKIAQILTDYLQASAFSTTWIANGLDVIASVKQNPPQLILLDLMLPGRDGLDLCREIRTFSQVPIIMITARVEEIDRLLGLELGADDYICKPFSPREVIARVKAILRRIAQLQAGSNPALPARLLIDESGFRASLDDQPLELTPVEFRLLATLATNPGRVFSRDLLVTHLYTDHRVVTDRTVDSHVKNLRRKLAEICPNEEIVRSIYGVGYRLEI